MTRKGTPSRRDRIIVLLNTLNDMREPWEPEYAATRHTTQESTALLHSDLYWAGSYPALEHCLDSLKRKAPNIHWHTMRVYVEKNPTSDGNGLAPAGRRLRSLHKANLGVKYLEKTMPPTILVPTDLLENEGYVVSSQARTRIAA